LDLRSEIRRGYGSPYCLTIQNALTHIFINNIVGYSPQLIFKPFVFIEIVGYFPSRFLSPLFSLTSWDIPPLFSADQRYLGRIEARDNSRKAAGSAAGAGVRPAT
jgi:hypothetical protein